MGCKDHTSSWHLDGFIDGSDIGSYNVGKKPTVILYTYINRHVGTPKGAKQKPCSTQLNRLVMVYDNSAIDI